MDIIKGYKNDNELDSVIRETQNIFQNTRVGGIMSREVKVMEEGKIRGFEVISSMKDEKVVLPKRSTEHSAGYDFFSYKDIVVPPSYSVSHKVDAGILLMKDVSKCEPFLVKTGVKAYMGEDEALFLYNRSSNPKKLGLVLANGVGVVDSDYYNNPDNEGEIGFLFYNTSSEPVLIKKGSKIGQGVFQKYLIADGDDTKEKRAGGFGSTGK